MRKSCSSNATLPTSCCKLTALPPWTLIFANLLNLTHACQASQGWPVLKSGQVLPKLHTDSSSCTAGSCFAISPCD